MKRIFIWLILIIVLLVGAVFSLPYLFSSDQVWAKVSPVLEQQVGRKISVAGDRKLSLYPNIAFVLGDVEIGSNISNDTPLASLESLRVSVDLLSLLSGKINVKELLLDGADISLIVGENGTANWQNNNDAPTQLPEQSANEDDPLGNLIAQSVNEPAPNSTENSVLPSFKLADLSVKNFKITNSRLTYENHQDGSFELAENVNINIDLSNSNKNLALDGNITWQKQPINFNLASFELENLINGQDSNLDFNLTSTPVNLDLLGQLHMGDNLGFDGNLSLDADSLKQLSTWLKIDLTGVNDSPIHLRSAVDLSGSTYQLGGLNLAMFGSQIDGTLNVSTAGVPNIYGKLAIDKLNYANIVPASAPTQTTENWSNAAIDANFLSSLNSNISLNIGQLDYDGIVSDNVSTTLIIRKSAAKLPIQMNIFGGQVKGDVSAQISSSGIAVTADIQATNIKAGNALQILDITDKLTATTNLNTRVSTSGGSVRQLMNNLNGAGSMAMGEGVIKGIAIADALAPEIANIDLSLNTPEKIAKFALEAGKALFDKSVSDLMSNSFGQNVGADKQTQFVDALFNFDIKNGVLTNQDLTINSENIIIRGGGDVDIGAKGLNYRVIPKLLRITENGTSERMTIPALITGTWANPSVAIDFAYAIQNSKAITNMRDKVVNKITKEITEKVIDVVKEQVVEKITEELTKQVGSELTNQLGEQLGDQLGNILDQSSENAPKSDAENLLDAGNLLNNLFNAPK